MNYKQHSSVGLVVFLIYCYLMTRFSQGYSLLLEGGLGVFVGSLFPDIDHPRSVASKLLWMLMLVINILHYFYYDSLNYFLVFFLFLSLILPYVLFRFLGGHRGPTHSLLFYIISMLLGFLFSQYFVLWFSIGAVLHLIFDCFSGNGVKLFWPYGNKIRFFKTNKR